MTQKNDIQARQDHETIRQTVGYYDFTHEMLEVTGPDRETFMDTIFTNGTGDLEPGKAGYAQMLNEDAIILDDIIIFRISDEIFWVSTLDIETMIKWMDEHKGDFDVTYTDFSEDNVMIALQGPKSREILNDIVEEQVDDLSWFTIGAKTIEGREVHIARAGFTGELGYEIYAKSDCKNILVDQLVNHDVAEMTSDAILSSLPREKGYILMSDVEGLNPCEAGFAWALDFDKEFIGRQAAQKAKEEGPSRKLYGFELAESPDEIDIEPGAKLEKDGKEVGQVTTVTYGYTVEKYIGFAVVDVDQADKGDEVSIGDYQAKVTDRLFYDENHDRLTQ